MFFIDFELLLAPLWAPVGPHESTFSATVSESLFKRRFHDIWWGRGTSGSVGILHFSLLEEVVMWVSAHFSICKLCAAP